MSFEKMFYMLILIISCLHPIVAHEVNEYDKMGTELPKITHKPQVLMSDVVVRGKVEKSRIHEEDEKEEKCIDDPNTPFDPKSVVFLGASTEDSIIVEVLIRDSQCLSTMTTTGFDIYMGVLSGNNVLLAIWKIESDMLEREEDTRTIAGRVSFPAKDLSTCFHRTPKVCVPTSEVLFIKYKGLPIDKPLSMEFIEFQTHVRFGKKNKHTFEGRHDILHPCFQLMDQVGFYQVGPRTGLFIKFDKDEEPTVGQVIRDWV